MIIDQRHEIFFDFSINKCLSTSPLSADDLYFCQIEDFFSQLCDEAYKATLAQSIFFVGAICGGLVFGWLSDKYGRIPILISTNMVGFIGGISTVGVTSFWQFCLCRFVVGLAYDNAFVIPYILVLEYIGPKWRTFVGNMSYGIFYCIMGMILPWIAFAIPDWRIFALVTSVPLVSAILAPLVISESVR